MAGLTQRQSALLDFIRGYSDRQGYAPNFDEMTAALGLASKSNIHRMLKGLEERGYVRRLFARARSIEIVSSLTADELAANLQRMSPEERRRLIAMAAGLEAHADGDGGFKAASDLRRIADCLTGAPRRVAA